MLVEGIKYKYPRHSFFAEYQGLRAKSGIVTSVTTVTIYRLNWDLRITGNDAITAVTGVTVYYLNHRLPPIERIARIKKICVLLKIFLIRDSRQKKSQSKLRVSISESAIWKLQNTTCASSILFCEVVRNFPKWSFKWICPTRATVK